jgi:glutathione synthase/RimK-type ligase-like ATP-grasp enzyme
LDYKLYFQYHRRSQPTGEKIASAFQIENGLDARLAQNREVLIRWGSRKNQFLDSHFNKVVNKAQAINLASNKLASLTVFQEWEIDSSLLKDNQCIDDFTINIPHFDQDPEELIKRVGFPILGRKTYHARGTDIKLCLQRRDFRQKMDYYVQYIPTIREYRLHVVGDEVIRIQGKFLDHPTHSLPWVRNYTTGYRFRGPRKKLRKNRLEMAVNAVKSLGLDFGAVDLIIADDGLGYVLEVNTAPSCSPLTATEYIMAIGRLIGHNGPYDLSHLDLLSPDEEEMDSDDLTYEEEE